MVFNSNLFQIQTPIYPVSANTLIVSIIYDLSGMSNFRMSLRADPVQQRLRFLCSTCLHELCPTVQPHVQRSGNRRCAVPSGRTCWKAGEWAQGSTLHTHSVTGPVHRGERMVSFYRWFSMRGRLPLLAGGSSVGSRLASMNVPQKTVGISFL